MSQHGSTQCVSAGTMKYKTQSYLERLRFLLSSQNNSIFNTENHITVPSKSPPDNMQIIKPFALIAIMAGLGLAATVPPAVFRRADLQNADDGGFGASPNLPTIPERGFSVPEEKN
ncbi:hypothetical protein BKA67DRAFT_689196 [Truncatella angustata]|uniref:Uncharacterized protein n=1 Tax=Truncatella angustata TaxID=152316 RepID=A0A9P8UTN5_9PEZI|nr:uncharacterized protein BKA67DRAFT_689196 [Truncatella angustata]KAH6657976.1 hypothetical protein BKA67DRAFT_689196 [Truncatella angustata]